MEIRLLPNLLRRYLNEKIFPRTIHGQTIFEIDFHDGGPKRLACRVRLIGLDATRRFVFQPDCDRTYHVSPKDIMTIRQVKRTR